MNFDDLLRGHLLIHRASVFKWFDYTFGNGDSKDKFFITLNCSINDFPINAVLPTSQHDNHHYSRPANMIDTVILEANESRFFNKKTIIDLKNIIYKEEEEIRNAYEDEYLIYLGDLEREIMERIESTIRNSDEIEPFKIAEYLCEA